MILLILIIKLKHRIRTELIFHQKIRNSISYYFFLPFFLYYLLLFYYMRSKSKFLFYINFFLCHVKNNVKRWYVTNNYNYDTIQNKVMHNFFFIRKSNFLCFTRTSICHLLYKYEFSFFTFVSFNNTTLYNVTCIFNLVKYLNVILKKQHTYISLNNTFLLKTKLYSITKFSYSTTAFRTDFDNANLNTIHYPLNIIRNKPIPIDYEYYYYYSRIKICLSFLTYKERFINSKQLFNVLLYTNVDLSIFLPCVDIYMLSDMSMSNFFINMVPKCFSSKYNKIFSSKRLIDIEKHEIVYVHDFQFLANDFSKRINFFRKDVRKHNSTSVLLYYCSKYIWSYLKVKPILKTLFKENKLPKRESTHKQLCIYFFLKRFLKCLKLKFARFTSFINRTIAYNTHYNDYLSYIGKRQLRVKQTLSFIKGQYSKVGFSNRKWLRCKALYFPTYKKKHKSSIFYNMYSSITQDFNFFFMNLDYILINSLIIKLIYEKKDISYSNICYHIKYHSDCLYQDSLPWRCLIFDNYLLSRYFFVLCKFISMDTIYFKLGSFILNTYKQAHLYWSYLNTSKYKHEKKIENLEQVLKKAIWGRMFVDRHQLTIYLLEFLKKNYSSSSSRYSTISIQKYITFLNRHRRLPKGLGKLFNHIWPKAFSSRSLSQTRRHSILLSTNHWLSRLYFSFSVKTYDDNGNLNFISKEWIQRLRFIARPYRLHNGTINMSTVEDNWWSGKKMFGDICLFFSPRQRIRFSFSHRIGFSLKKFYKELYSGYRFHKFWLDDSRKRSLVKRAFKCWALGFGNASWFNKIFLIECNIIRLKSSLKKHYSYSDERSLRYYNNSYRYLLNKCDTSVGHIFDIIAHYIAYTNISKEKKIKHLLYYRSLFDNFGNSWFYICRRIKFYRSFLFRYYKLVYRRSYILSRFGIQQNFRRINKSINFHSFSSSVFGNKGNKHQNTVFLSKAFSWRNSKAKTLHDFFYINHNLFYSCYSRLTQNLHFNSNLSELDTRLNLPTVSIKKTPKSKYTFLLNRLKQDIYHFFFFINCSYSICYTTTCYNFDLFFFCRNIIPNLNGFYNRLFINLIHAIKESFFTYNNHFGFFEFSFFQLLPKLFKLKDNDLHKFFFYIFSLLSIRDNMANLLNFDVVLPYYIWYNRFMLFLKKYKFKYITVKTKSLALPRIRVTKLVYYADKIYHNLTLLNNSYNHDFLKRNSNTFSQDHHNKPFSAKKSARVNINKLFDKRKKKTFFIGKSNNSKPEKYSFLEKCIFPLNYHAFNNRFRLKLKSKKKKKVFNRSFFKKMKIKERSKQAEYSLHGDFNIRKFDRFGSSRFLLIKKDTKQSKWYNV